MEPDPLHGVKDMTNPQYFGPVAPAHSFPVLSAAAAAAAAAASDT